MLKKLFYKFLIFFSVFLVLCTSFVALAVDLVPDDYIGRWDLDEDRVPCYYQSFYMRGHFEFPEVEVDLQDYGINNIDIIGVSITDEGTTEDGENEYVSGYFWVSEFEMYNDGKFIRLCTFTAYYDPYVDPDPMFSVSSVHYYSWSIAPITYFNILSLEPEDDFNLIQFSEFVEFNFHRYYPPTPPEPTNVYQSFYDLMNTWIFAGTVVQGSYQDLVLIFLSTLCVLFLVALPFQVVFWLIRRL